VHTGIDDLSAKLTVLMNLVLWLSSDVEQIKNRLAQLEKQPSETVDG
jgi:hypothetical protein